jgi:hypothetical protein
VFEQERRDDRIYCRQVLVEYGIVTPERFEQAQKCGFPASISRAFTGEFKGQSIYSRKRIAEWATGLRALAAAVK